MLELPISNIFKLQKLWDVCLKQKIYAKIVNIRNGGNNSRGSLLIGMLWFYIGIKNIWYSDAIGSLWQSTLKK